ncbi:type I-E CRISPR-associated protein Cas5/CasD [Lactobacillus agrestimuris]|uniref:type I-E CRISPR-associated protein Cas5/CasD n=1 Tax=Lactobacillus agrestimuris TaxID=2941328 RepID=UPI002043056C|nr:type I-E CRISPR-associated protein Cas5/CasD [Lactobacillus agrestimuris]
MKTLTIKLNAPLQSYGNEASFNQRTSKSYPTKSAVLGMIAASLGYRRDNSKILVLNDLSFAVRVDQPGSMLTDFQIVRYGKKAGDQKLTYRKYLQDSVFMVAIGSEDNELIEKIKYSLHHPKFQLFLGRRSNPIAGLLEIREFTGINPVEALKQIPWQAATWYQKRYHGENYKVELIADASLLPDQEVEMVKQKIRSFDQRNRYHEYNSIAHERFDLKNEQFNLEDTDHDIYSII